ncbi:Serine/threonine protein kinase [Pseudovibrio ascidiaceicola]|uniref:Serine/threonine protein kinase n=1 Tax=Pseudovibrio ascidiaceicola TaxID=285279 RepID=A0A1I4FKD7_9HYPH|nr:protein kinase [Pseudovibrio ascidiaceicola]SFL16921.1 Serine/threonine protein kinase [Pseudovibrio ascidiaceicola]
MPAQPQDPAGNQETLPPEQEQWLDAVERALNVRLGEIPPQGDNAVEQMIVDGPEEERGEFMALVEDEEQENIEEGIEQRPTRDQQGRIIEERGEFLALGDDEDERDIERGAEQRGVDQRQPEIPFEAPPPYDPPPPYEAGEQEDMDDEEFEELELPEHRELHQHDPQPGEGEQPPERRLYNEMPQAGSPIRLNRKNDGTMVIDRRSVPATIKAKRERRIGRRDKVTYEPTEHSMNVEGLLTPPNKVDNERLQSVFASGATGYLQKFPDIEDSAIKRCHAMEEANGSLQFVGADQIVHETKILTALSHFKDAKGAENIIEYRGSGISQFGDPFLIMEEMNGGTLANRIPDDRGLDEPQLNDFAKGVLSGMTFLQNRNIIHQDLKADNILFRDNDSTVPVISDFDTASAHEGIASDHENGRDFGYKRGGSPDIQPPEVHDDNGQMTGKIDSWNGGILMLQAAIGNEGRQAFLDETAEFRRRDGRRDQGLYDAFLDPRIANVPPNIQAVIKGLLKIDLNERMAAEQALALIEDQPEDEQQ